MLQKENDTGFLDALDKSLFDFYDHPILEWDFSTNNTTSEKTFTDQHHDLIDVVSTLDSCTNLNESTSLAVNKPRDKVMVRFILYI